MSPRYLDDWCFPVHQPLLYAEEEVTVDDDSRAKIEQFQRLVHLDPEGDISHYGLAKAYFDCGTLAEGRGDSGEASHMFLEAIREYETVLRIKPDYAACFLFLGLAQQKSGMKDNALRTYQGGMKVAEKNGDLHLRKRMWDQVQVLEGKASSPPPPGTPGRPPETGPVQAH